MQTNIDIDIADNFDKMLIMNGNLWNADISAYRWKLELKSQSWGKLNVEMLES